jgi:hypothetical protein
MYLFCALFQRIEVWEGNTKRRRRMEEEAGPPTARSMAWWNGSAHNPGCETEAVEATQVQAAHDLHIDNKLQYDQVVCLCIFFVRALRCPQCLCLCLCACVYRWVKSLKQR